MPPPWWRTYECDSYTEICLPFRMTQKVMNRFYGDFPKMFIMGCDVPEGLQPLILQSTKPFA